jgi:uncharacterized protein DUF397
MSYPSVFVRSTYCEGNSACFEFAPPSPEDGPVLVRNSQVPAAVIDVEAAGWADFISWIRAGQGGPLAA